MERFDIEVVNHEKRTLVEHAVAIENSREMWLWIGRVARRNARKGATIRVLNAQGYIVALVGVATALQLCAEFFSNLPTL
ncbi:MAG: hypothetical protein KGL46_04545 [Hyphomicrobiales bacterium]|nr:hypothetical protein [Hyphomicrobiales bacterium]